MTENIADRLARTNAVAEVAAKNIANVVDELNEEGLVESKLLADCCPDFRLVYCPALTMTAAPGDSSVTMNTVLITPKGVQDADAAWKQFFAVLLLG